MPIHRLRGAFAVILAGIFAIALVRALAACTPDGNDGQSSPHPDCPTRCDANATLDPALCTCACNAGFEGDGVTCQPVEEVALPPLPVAAGVLAPAYPVVGVRPVISAIGISDDEALIAIGAANDQPLCLANDCPDPVASQGFVTRFTKAADASYEQAAVTSLGIIYSRYGSQLSMRPDGMQYMASGLPVDEFGERHGQLYATTRDGDAWVRSPSDVAFQYDAGKGFVMAYDHAQTVRITGMPFARLAALLSGGGAIERLVEGAWQTELLLFPGNGGEGVPVGYQAGMSVALSADGQWAALGAPFDADPSQGIAAVPPAALGSGQPMAGAVYLYRHVNAAWTLVAYIKPPFAESGDQFGASLGFVGTYLVIGAPGDDASSTTVERAEQLTDDDDSEDSGAIWVYALGDAPSDELVLHARLKVPHAVSLGRALATASQALAAPYDNDSAVGGVLTPTADLHDATAAGSGAVALFAVAGQAWQTRAVIKPPMPAPAQAFGAAYSVSDMNFFGIPAMPSNSLGLNAAGTLLAVPDVAGDVYLYAIPTSP